MRRLLKWLMRIVLVGVAIPVTAFLFVLLNYFLISFSAWGRITHRVADLESRPAVLVLGAGNSEPGKWVNHTFEHRMEAAARIWKKDQGVHFIVSGQILPPYYDEAADMKERLLFYGVPSSHVTCDSNGTRTWISVRHAAELRNGKNLVIVSQQEHLERALFCASCQGLKATGLAAEPQPYEHRFWTYREYLARVKATWDCVVFRLKNQ